MGDFFISSTGVDRAWAEWIAWQLEAAGYTVVLQAWHFDPGTNFIQAMHQASIDAKRTIAVLSPDYFTARFTQSEWQAAFWEMAMQRVQDEQPAAADLIHLCAFLAPDDIPCDLIRDGCEHLPETMVAAVADPLAFDEAIAVLRRYSLLEVEHDALGVHRLVQAVARDRLGEEARAAWAAVAVRLVQRAFRFDENEVNTWPICARLLPHALNTAEYTETFHVAAEETGRLLDDVGRYLRVRGQFNEARTVNERALAIAEVTYGPSHPTVAIRLSNLGSVLRDLGELAAPRAAYERAVEIFQTFLGVEHPSTKKAQANLDAVIQAISTSPDTA